MKKEDISANESFENEATEFYSDTGYMMCGKDDMRGIHTHEERQHKYREWKAEKEHTSQSAGHIVKPELTEAELKADKLEEIFWGYLHTVTFAHDKQPNEPHRQVIFKEDVPKIITAILTALKGDKK